MFSLDLSMFEARYIFTGKHCGVDPRQFTFKIQIRPEQFIQYPYLNVALY